MDIKFKKSPVTGEVIDIELEHNQGARRISPNVGLTYVSISNPDCKMEFVVFINRMTGRRIALAPMTAEWRAIVDEQERLTRIKNDGREY